jgi:hypothetical protein
MIWHTRLACACKEVMQRTQRNVKGMNVQQDSWKSLDTLLPCSSCVAGKMRKANSPSTQTYSDIRALTTDLLAQQNPARHFGFTVSQTPAATAQINQRNQIVSVGWAIVNKQSQPDVFNVFALFIDHNIGLVHVEFQLTRGQAGEALEGYIQQWGVPNTIHHDNAQEFLHILSAKPTASHKHNLPPTHRTRTLPNTTWN